MIPNFEKIESNINHSFHINHMKVDVFPSLRHYHPEVEILLVENGRGTRYVGDSVEPYEPDDIGMIGQACRLLVNENISIEQTGYSCGFSNISYFIRQFNKITGYTPLAYKVKFSD